MLEQETNLIISTVSQRTIAGAESVFVKDILAADIPYPIKTFFRADVEAMLAEELRNQRKASRFNYTHPEIQSLQNQIDSILVLHYSFRRTEYLQRLDEAVHMLGNFLIRPQWTLANALFENDETISSAMLARLLKHFGPYEYLRNLITHYVRDKNVASFTKADFSSLVARMDGEYIRRKAGDELARVMSPIYDFFDYPKNTGTKPFPVKALIRYFEDKGLSSVTTRLEGEASQEKQELTLRALGEMLEEVRRTSGAFEVEKWESRTDLELQTVPNAEPGIHAIQPEAGTRRLAIMDSISEGDRRRFVRKIFNQDESLFDSAVDSIGTLTSWKEASKFIDQILIRNDVDPYSPEAERFVMIISQQFQPKR
jgi:hypothetical protein